MSAEPFDVVVIGGGPAGSATAAIAARAGLRVALLEAGEHPRAHVGESLLPGVIPILAEMGALDAIERAGFQRKSGSTHYNWGRTPRWDLWFKDSEEYDHAWLVDRSRFDTVLFEAAVAAGAHASTSTPVSRLLWNGERLAAVEVVHAGARRELRGRLFVDASGQAALIARELDLRSMIEGLQNRAEWAHFEGAGLLPPPRNEQAFFVAEKGAWLWLFPLGGGRTSVGMIRLDDDQVGLEETVRASADMSPVLGDARRVTPVRRERDWSYRMSRVTGPGWLLAGDASGFIDPVLSTGVLLGMHAGWLAARAAVDIVQRGRDEAEARAEYQRAHAALFEDLLRIVRFFYKQNLHREDYFWESKRILVDHAPDLRPQKAFLVLTSGLVGNLALEETRKETLARREREVASGAALDDVPPGLGFVCFHLRHRTDDPADLYLLIEPADPAAPTLFRTASYHVNCLAPRYDNDPILVPALEPPLRKIDAELRRLDDVPGESLAAFFRRRRADLRALVSSLGPDLELVRVFGE